MVAAYLHIPAQTLQYATAAGAPAGPAAAQSPGNANNANFWAAINANPNLKSMSNFVTGDTRNALMNPKLAPYTIFAPTDEGARGAGKPGPSGAGRGGAGRGQGVTAVYGER